MKRPQRSQPMGPKSVRGSESARRLAALMMEAWSGVRSTQAACAAMGISVTRFYQLEARAVQHLVAAPEPRPRGRRLTAASELGKLKLENQRLRRDLERFQSLYRTAQRTLGVAVAKPVGKRTIPRRAASANAVRAARREVRPWRRCCSGPRRPKGPGRRAMPRPNKGLGHVNALAGDLEDKWRLKVVLATLTVRCHKRRGSGQHSTGALPSKGPAAGGRGNVSGITPQPAP
jgi:hypothetical protein